MNSISLVIVIILINLNDGSVQSSLIEQYDALSPNEWVSRLDCKTIERSNKTLIQLLMGHECDQQPDVWRWRYVDELIPAFHLQIHENLIDERLANIVDISSANRPLGPSGQNVDFNNTKLLQSLVGPQVDDKLCGYHLEQILEQIDEMKQILAGLRLDRNNSIRLSKKHLHLAQVLDSFGRYDSGFLTGRIQSGGDYEQCLSGRLLLVDRDGFAKSTASRFCWAQVNMNKHLDSSLKQRRLSAYESSARYLSVGICLPESCHTKSFVHQRRQLEALVKHQFALPESIYLDQEYELETIVCLPDSNSEYYLKWPTNRIIFTGSILCWILATIIATLVVSIRSKCNNDKREHRHQSMAQKVTEALDLSSSWNDFLGQSMDKPSPRDQEVSRVNLSPFNGLRVVLCMSVVFAHASVFTVFFSRNYIQAMAEYDTNPLHLFIRSYFAIIDTFFVIGGMFAAYIGIGRVRKYFGNQIYEATPLMQVKQLATVWPFIGLKRLARLLPVYLIVLGFVRTSFKYLGSGPNWDYAYDSHSMVGMCSQDKLMDIFTIFYCVPQAWYLASDLYSSVIFVPPVVYLIAAKRFKLAYFLIGLLTFVICPGKVLADFLAIDPSQTYSVRELRVHGLLEYMVESSHIYMAPFYRVNRILIGVVTGHLLHIYETNQDKHFKWPNWLRGPATWISFLIVILLMLPTAFINQIKQLTSPSYRLFPLYQLTFIPIVWSISSAILFLRMATDQRDNFFVRLSSGKFFKTMDRMGFAIYLVHLHLALYLLSSSSSVVNFSVSYHYTIFAASYFFSLPISALLFVVFENPIDKLSRLALPV